MQKTSPDYDPEKGCKWSAQQLRKYLVARHGIDTVSIVTLDPILLSTNKNPQVCLQRQKKKLNLLEKLTYYLPYCCMFRF